MIKVSEIIDYKIIEISHNLATKRMKYNEFDFNPQKEFYLQCVSKYKNE